MRGWCSHLQSFHSSRYVFLRQQIICHISWCRLKNEDAVMGQGFVSHASFGPGKEGKKSGQCTGYIPPTLPCATSPGQKDHKEARVGCISLNFRFVHISCLSVVTASSFYTQKEEVHTVQVTMATVTYLATAKLKYPGKIFLLCSCAHWVFSPVKHWWVPTVDWLVINWDWLGLYY